jgi:hypothetical protein
VLWRPKIKRHMAFSSEVATGSREENASKPKPGSGQFAANQPPSIRLTIRAA